MLRLTAGAGLVQGERAGLIDRALAEMLPLAGAGLAPPPAGFRGSSLRAKVQLALHVGGAGLRVEVSYFGRVPGVRALAAARGRLGVSNFLEVEGGAGAEILLKLVHQEPPRDLSVVMVEAGGMELALPMNFVRRAEPCRDDDAAHATAPSLARCLDRAPEPGRAGRPAVLTVGMAGTEHPLGVDAVVGHRLVRVHCVGPLLGNIPWLLGVIGNGEDAATLVVHPGRLLHRRSRVGAPGEPGPVSPDPPTGA